MIARRQPRIGSRVRAGVPATVAAACVAALLRAMTAEAGQVTEPATTSGSSVADTQTAPAAPWKVIVHPTSPLRSMPRADLERIYRRRSRFWPDHSAILPLNLPGDDPLRRAFSSEVLRSDEDELATYWNRQYFQGVMPPAVLQSSGAVRAYVAATPGAIGYVSVEAVDSSVAVLEVTDAH